VNRVEGPAAPAGRPEKVAILGAGVGAMAAAFELTKPELEGRYDVTVHTLGWRIGGKGASGRGPHGRVEEHGLHIWFGFYENAFHLMRTCYQELERGADVPIRTVEDAFHPAPRFGVAESRLDRWLNWILTFPENDEVPGDGKHDTQPPTVGRYIVEFMRMAESLTRSLWQPIPPLHVRATAPPPPPPPTCSVRVTVPRQPLNTPRLVAAGQLVLGEMFKAADAIELTILAVAIELATTAEMLADWSDFRSSAIVLLLDGFVEKFEERATATMGDTPSSRQVVEIMDTTMAIVRGLLSSSVTTHELGFGVLDDYDLRDWLFLHGARQSTVEGGFLKGLYDLVFAYREGDAERPALSAAQGMRGIVKMFFDYKGAFAFRMQAGMGDVVFAPIYEVLRRRGVQFEFFRELESVVPSDDGQQIEELVLWRQANLAGPGPYEPLVDVKGLPCWPSEPDWSQLVDEGAGDRRHFESPWPEPERVGKRLRLRAGVDFDHVVYGLSLGSVPTTCAQLVEHRHEWRAMVDHVGTVATQAFQIWLTEDTAQLGGDPTSPVIAAYIEPFDTWADMTHLLEVEDWPIDNGPKSIHYFCSPLPCAAKAPLPGDRDTQALGDAEVLKNTMEFLNLAVDNFLPGAVEYYPREFRWSLLAGAEGCVDGPPVASQHLRANVAPSERYVLSLPGTTRFRLAPSDSGYQNLFLAGDWTHVGLDAGCVETAATSGLLAARALRGDDTSRIAGMGHP
jgi:uncharacterized protein with NAD-binding domain and iron-sulfur cluster